MRTPERISEQYHEGDLTRTDYFISLMQAITEENAAEFVAFTSSDLLVEVRVYVAGCPHDEEGWARLRWYTMKTWRRDVTQGEVEAAFTEECRRHRRGVEVLRDVLGPRPLPAVSPGVLAWDGGIIVQLATTIYQEGDFSRQSMGVLADALEEAGVSDAQLLGHLRSDGPHVRGCFAVDLILSHCS